MYICFFFRKIGICFPGEGVYPQIIVQDGPECQSAFSIFSPNGIQGVFQLLLASGVFRLILFKQADLFP